MGELLFVEVVCGMLLLWVQLLLLGYLGVCVEVVELLFVFFNVDVLLVVLLQGSVGVLGDFVLLVYFVFGLIGLGDIEYQGQVCFVVDVLVEFGLSLVQLQVKEGLVFINGMQLMGSLFVLVLYDVQVLLGMVNFVVVMMVEVCYGLYWFFQFDVVGLCLYFGVLVVVVELCEFLVGFEIVFSYLIGDGKVQDVYLLWVVLQVYGVMWDVLVQVECVLVVEFVLVIDNLLIFFEMGEVVFGGNFYG